MSILTTTMQLQSKRGIRARGRNGNFTVREVMITSIVMPRTLDGTQGTVGLDIDVRSRRVGGNPPITIALDVPTARALAESINNHLSRIALQERTVIDVVDDTKSC